MGNPKDDKKKMDAAKKEVQGEVKKMSLKMRTPLSEVGELLKRKAELEAKKDQTPEDKAELKDIDAKLATLRKTMEKEMLAGTKRIDLMLKKHIPGDKKEAKAWEKGFAGGVVDLFKADPGLKIGKQFFIGADVSIPKKKIKLTLTYKFK
ncbi:MAG: hypothetical protein COB08_002985 [Rhodobacteraceae bacterium]|nr:hypothetical protein [Paracoccaceae bacterium]